MNANNLINRSLTPYISKIFNFLPVITLTGPRHDGEQENYQDNDGIINYRNI